MTLTLPFNTPETLSVLKFGSKNTLTLVVAPGYKKWFSSLIENGIAVFKLKLIGNVAPLVKISYFYKGWIGTFFYHTYLKFIFF